MGLCHYCNLADEYVQPYQLQGMQRVIWVCPWCGVPAGATVLPVSYTHERYCPGLNVYVSPALREIHPLSPCAGLVLLTCEGVYYPRLEMYRERLYTSYVPVCLSDGRVFFVEEEYVSAG